MKRIFRYIPYYSPNFSFKTLIAFFKFKNNKSYIVDYFKEYTGKKYVLLTSSARSALYLAYKSLKMNGEVITSPLTCLTAILPIIHSNNSPIFADINKKTLNFDIEEIKKKITSRTIAIQAIHFAGMPCDMDSIKKICNDKNIYLIEDCAQGFGAEYNSMNVGSFGDISCFSLSKNLYGLSGGIFVTNDKNIFESATYIQNNFEKTKITFIYYRLLRNVIKSYSNNIAMKYLHEILINFKNKTKSSSNLEMSDLVDYLKKPNNKSFNVSNIQLQNLNKYHKKRIKNGELLREALSSIEELNFPESNSNVKKSFVKFYLYSNNITPSTILKLNKFNIEAKHLEEEYGVFFQERFDRNKLFYNCISLNDCNNYIEIHDKLLSLPLFENMSSKDIEYIKSVLLKILF